MFVILCFFDNFSKTSTSVEYPVYKGDFWQTEIKKMLKIGKKAEQQSFSKYGLKYVVDTYFPAKFEEMENQA